MIAASVHAQDAQLLAYWAFDDSENDSVAVDEINAVEAEIDGPTYESDPTRGSVMNIAATGSLYVPDGDFLNAIAENDTASFVFWQRNDAQAVASSSFWLLSASSNNGERGAQAHVPWNNQNVYFDTAGCCDPPQRLNGVPNIDIEDGEWHHFAFIKDGENKKIYIDGELELEGDGYDPLPDDFYEMRIGSTGDAGASLDGAMDDFAIFSTPLSIDQIGLLVAGSSPLELVDDTDTDEDGMPDVYEENNGLDPAVNDAAGDLDNDGVSNFTEFENRTDPQKDDSDGDGVKDGAETNTGTFVDSTNTGSNPLSADSDADGIPDGVETGSGTFVSASDPGTDPNKADTDGDTYEDRAEITVGTDPTKADSVPNVFWDVLLVEGLDAITNIATAEEWIMDDTLDRTEGSHFALNFEGSGCSGSLADPIPFDHQEEGEDLDQFVVQANGTIFVSERSVYTFGFGSDDGGFVDVGEERVALFNGNRGRGISLGQILLVPGFYDVTALMWENGGGSCFDVFWAKGALDAFNPTDFQLLSPTSLKPEDTDGDGMDDNVERAYFGDLSKNADGDEDSDTLTNGAEIANGTSPVSDDTDEDTLKDNFETGTGTWVSAENTGTDPGDVDSDGDNLADNVETNTGIYVGPEDTGSNPNLADTDGGGVSDGSEVEFGTNPNIPNDDPGGLLVAWDFEDSADDSKAVDLVGGIEAVNEGAEYVDDPERGSVIDFAGTGYLTVEDAAFLNTASATDQVTFVFWQLNGGTPNSSTFWAVSPSTGNNMRGAQVHVPWSNGQIYFDTAGCCGGGDTRLNFDPAVEVEEGFDFGDGEWHHYAFVKDGENKTVYIDGKVAFETVNTNPLPDDFSELWLGAEVGAINIADARIDDFGVYAGARTAEQIIDVMENGFGGGGPIFQILDVTRVGPGNAEVTWQSKAGSSYSIDYTSDFVDWIEGTDGFEADSDTAVFEDDSLNAEVVERYYRVRRE